MRLTDTSHEIFLALSQDPALRRRFLVLNEPIPGNMRFGILLEQLDWLAAETALEHARRVTPAAHVVTAAVDEIVVRHPANADHDIVCRARLNRVGRTSMEVGIRVETTEPCHIASCYFTMVARDGDTAEAHSIAVPPLEAADELERHRVERATQRQAAWRARLAAASEPPSREEFDLLSALHRAQEDDAFDGLLAGKLGIESWERTYPEQENWSKVIFGGYIMRRAYELSSLCAERVAPRRPVIAAVNRVNFFHPVQIGDKLHITARAVYTEGPAICVETSIQRISRDRTASALSNSCLFTFVNVRPEMTLEDVPPIHPATYAEDARWLDARRNLHALAARMRGGWLGLAPARGA